MMNANIDKSSADEISQFFGILQDCIEQNNFIRLILGKYRGDEKDLQNIEVKRIMIKEREHLSFTYRYKTKDVTKNFPVDSGIEFVREMFAKGFKSAHLFSMMEDVQMEFSKKGKCILSRSKATCDTIPDMKHNRDKNRLIDPASQFLRETGISNGQGQILPSMSRKWKQINVFLEIFQRAFMSSKLSEGKKVHLVDFGSGKGYLTFAAYDFLRNIPSIDPQVTGVEIREELVKFCNDVAMKMKMTGLCFRQGDLKSFNPEKVDIMIALHACDTATDLAIHMGISSGAEIIMCAPCCHKELRSQIKIPPLLQPMLKFGVHLGQEAEMLTDSLRALLLEDCGYETQVFEFISLEHTSKNKMILAVKRSTSEGKSDIRSQIKAIKDFYGIKGIHLESLLGRD